RPGAAERTALDAPGLALLRRVARALPRRRLAAEPARPLAVADPGRRLRRLPVSQAVHVALPLLARRRRRARPRRRLGRDHGEAAVAGVAARRGGRSLARRLRPLLRALRRGGGSPGRAPLDRDAVRRGRRLSRGPAVARRDGRLSRRRRPRTAGRSVLLGRRRRGRAAPRLRALPRPARRPAPARHRVLHDERRHLGRLRRLRRPRRRDIGARGRRRETAPPVGASLYLCLRTWLLTARWQ